MKMKAEQFDPSILELKNLNKELSWDCCYAIEAIKSLGIVGSFLLDHYSKQLSAMPVSLSRFLKAMYQHLKKDMSLPNLQIDKDKYDEKQPESGQIPMKTVTIK